MARRLDHISRVATSGRLRELAPQVGLQTTTLRLTAECSAIELLRNTERAMFGRTCANYSYNKASQSGSRRLPPRQPHPSDRLEAALVPHVGTSPESKRTNHQ